MADLTPRLAVGTPSEFEEPFFQTGRNRDLAWDALIFANAENSQLQFLSTGVVGWDSTAAAPKGVLFWTEDIQVTGFTTPFKAVIAGGVSVELADGEILFFVMPRTLRANQTVTVYRANRIFLEGQRLPNLRLFAARVGTTVYFYNGASLTDGQQGPVFGGGLFPATTTPLHRHLVPLIVEPASSGISLLDALSTSPDLIRVDLFRNGKLQADPADYTISLATGIITLVVPTVSATERFIIWREERDPVGPLTDHDHLAALVLNPAPATGLIDVLLSDPFYQNAAIFRNGDLQSEPADYTLNTTTGFATLVVPTIAGERFVILRRANV